MRSRAWRGRFGALPGERTLSLRRIASVSLMLAAAAGLFGIAVVGAGMPTMASHPAAMLLLRGACGAAIGAGMTLTALLLLLARGHGTSKRKALRAR